MPGFFHMAGRYLTIKIINMTISQINTFKDWARHNKALKVEPIEAPIKANTTTNTALNSKQRNSQRWFERQKTSKV